MKKSTSLSLLFFRIILSLILSTLLGFKIELFAEIMLLSSLNILGIPLAFVLSPLPAWVWYVIVMDWIGTIMIWREEDEEKKNKEKKEE